MVTKRYSKLGMDILPFISICLILPCVTVHAARAGQTQPKNVIFFIGDGMGPEQVKAANYYKGGSLSFESFPNTGFLTTYAANESVTDSAAAATAMATGVKVNNGVISIATPGDGSELETLLAPLSIADDHAYFRTTISTRVVGSEVSSFEDVVGVLQRVGLCDDCGGHDRECE